MRESSLRFWGVALVFIGLLLVSLPAAQAQLTPCEQQCLDRFMADRKLCEEALAAKLQVLSQEEADCARFLPSQPRKYMQCMQTVAGKKAQAYREKRHCDSVANTKGWNCYRRCQQSRYRP